MVWRALAGGALLAAIGGLAARYARQRDRVDRSWLVDVEPHLMAIG
jgi:hypothetical protein